MTNEDYVRALRTELAALRAHGDDDPAVYVAIKEIETAISWHVHTGRTPTVVRVAKMETCK
jgi:hypothetical protein